MQQNGTKQYLELHRLPQVSAVSLQHQHRLYPIRFFSCRTMNAMTLSSITGLYPGCRRTVFPNHTMRRQDEAKAGSQVQILLVGIRPRAIPLPVQLYYQQQQNPAPPTPPSAPRHEAPADAKPPPPGTTGNCLSLLTHWYTSTAQCLHSVMEFVKI